jgi:transketolase
MEDILAVMGEWLNNPQSLSAPQVIIANTIKGYGVLCMENVPKFHFRLPTEEELKMGKRYG